MRFFRSALATIALALAACPSTPRAPEPEDPDEEEVPVVEQGQPCEDAYCAEGYDCIEYYGIAGPSGPKFTSCEIPCADDEGCPDGQKCITIADGPGQVCRPTAIPVTPVNPTPPLGAP